MVGATIPDPHHPIRAITVSPHLPFFILTALSISADRWDSLQDNRLSMRLRFQSYDIPKVVMRDNHSTYLTDGVLFPVRA